MTIIFALLMATFFLKENAPIYLNRKMNLGMIIQKYEIDNVRKIIKALLILLSLGLIIIFFHEIINILDIIYLVSVYLYLCTVWFNNTRPVGIYENGIKFNNKKILWSEISEVRNRGRTVAIKSTQKWNGILNNGNILRYEEMIKEIKKELSK